MTCRVDGFEPDVDRFELRRQGKPVPVEPQVLSLPALLARHPGFSLPFAEQKLFYLKRDDQRRFCLDALARAGVPAS